MPLSDCSKLHYIFKEIPMCYWWMLYLYIVFLYVKTNYITNWQNTWYVVELRAKAGLYFFILVRCSPLMNIIRQTALNSKFYKRTPYSLIELLKKTLNILFINYEIHIIKKLGQQYFYIRQAHFYRILKMS